MIEGLLANLRVIQNLNLFLLEGIVYDIAHYMLNLLHTFFEALVPLQFHVFGFLSLFVVLMKGARYNSFYALLLYHGRLNVNQQLILIQENVFLIHALIVIEINGFVFTLGLHGNVEACALHSFGSDID